MHAVEILTEPAVIMVVNAPAALLRLHLSCNGVHAVVHIGVWRNQVFFTVSYHQEAREL
jgi:hypothetical protein